MWVLPTYNRADRAQMALDSLIEMGCSSPGLVYLDGATYDHLRLPKGWKVWKKETNGGVCAALNDVFAHFTNLPWYGFISDDSLARTPGWDQILLSHLDPFGIVHSADGWRTEERIHGAVVFGGELLRALGWWVPQGLKHCFCDDVWEILGKRLGIRKYVPQVMIEHLHCGNGKATVDAGYLKAYASFEEDQKVFLQWQNEDLEKALQKWAQRKSSFPSGDSATSSRP